MFIDISNCIDISVAIGCNMVLITSGWSYYNEPVKDAWKRSALMLTKIAKYAEKEVTLRWRHYRFQSR